MSDEGDRDYEVGYGKPPASGRFVKGKSGNPKGRPRGSKNKPSVKLSFNAFVDVCLREMDRPVQVKEGGEPVELSFFEAAVRRLSHKAIQGDHRSAKLLIDLRREAENARMGEIAEHVAFVERYKREWAPKFAAAKREGKPPPDLLPHPDHVQICEETGVMVVNGPLTIKQKEAWDLLKEHLHVYDTIIRSIENKVAKGSNDPLESCLKRAYRDMRKELQMVPPNWNWREDI